MPKKYISNNTKLDPIKVGINTISKGSQMLLGKTKKFIEHNVYETKISNLYNEIGKAVYDEHNLNINNEKKIKKMLNEIDKLKEDMKNN